MNRSIGCGPMPFALAGDKAAATDATLLRESKDPKASFSEVLDSEIEEDAESEKDRRTPTDVWAVYGIAPVTVQIPPSIALSIPKKEPWEGIEAESNEPAVQNQGEHLAEQVSTKGESALVKGAVTERPEDALKMRLETLKLAEQKVPSALKTELRGREQIAENPPKPAKIAYGMVAAQGESMVSESPTQEETALEQNLLLSAELFTGTDSPQSVALKSVSKEGSPKIDIDFADFAPVESFTTEWSSFEGSSETSERQPVKASEAVELVRALRTHVQVLKGSGQEKLDVVLRPDGHTELWLHVEKVNGQILVQARCDRGDFARLEANWNSVQQSLANHGVRVESLEHGNCSQNSNEFQNPSRAFDERSAAEPQRDSNFIEQKSRATKNPQPATNRGTVHGWQSWA